MEWEAPGIVLEARPYGDGDLIVASFTADHGVHRGLARGGASRGRIALWQIGNLVSLRWVGRLPEQLGSLTGEMIQAIAPGAMDDAMSLGLLRAVCSVAVGALPEREAHPPSFAALLHLLPRIAANVATAGDLGRFETVLLADLGYGLDLARCAVTGETEGLSLVLAPYWPRRDRGRGGIMAGADAAPARLPARRGRDRKPGRLARRVAADRALPGA